MPEIIFKIKGKKVGKFKAKVFTKDGKTGRLSDGREVKKEGKNWVYEAK